MTTETYKNAAAKSAHEWKLTAVYMLIKDMDDWGATTVLTNLIREAAAQNDWKAVCGKKEDSFQGYGRLWEIACDAQKLDRPGKIQQGIDLIWSLARIVQGRSDSVLRDRNLVIARIMSFCMSALVIHVANNADATPYKWHAILNLVQEEPLAARKCFDIETLHVPNAGVTTWLLEHMTGQPGRKKYDSSGLLAQIAQSFVQRLIRSSDAASYVTVARLVGPAIVGAFEHDSLINRDQFTAACIASVKKLEEKMRRANALADDIKKEMTIKFEGSDLIAVPEPWKWFELKAIKHDPTTFEITQIELVARTGHGDIYELPITERRRLIEDQAEMLHVAIAAKCISHGIADEICLTIGASYQSNGKMIGPDTIDAPMKLEIKAPSPA